MAVAHHLFSKTLFKLHRPRGEGGKEAKQTSVLHGPKNAFGINTAAPSMIPAAFEAERRTVPFSESLLNARYV